MYTLNQLSDYINHHISQISYPNDPAGLYQPIEYTLQGGGKRLRPVLALAACVSSGGEIGSALPQAIGIEIFHNFTLLHDDVMDKATTRRGKMTVHLKWDDSTAILSGDAMLTLATQYISDLKNPCILPGVLGLFNKTAMEIYEGQQYDMDFESRDDVTIDEYMKMITLKTSVLLGCACKLGAIVGGASKGEQQLFYDFGLKLGLAFQLQDDYLDTYGDPDVFGKKIGGDILNEKKTWLLISALESDRATDVRALLGGKVSDEEKISRMRDIYNDLKLPEKCRTLICDYINEAVSAIDALAIPTDAREFFITLARQSACRDH